TKGLGIARSDSEQLVDPIRPAFDEEGALVVDPSNGSEPPVGRADYGRRIGCDRSRIRSQTTGKKVVEALPTRRHLAIVEPNVVKPPVEPDDGPTDRRRPLVVRQPPDCVPDLGARQRPEELSGGVRERVHPFIKPRPLDDFPLRGSQPERTTGK